MWSEEKPQSKDAARYMWTLVNGELMQDSLSEQVGKLALSICPLPPSLFV